jgi:P-type Cu+ transporter
MALEPLAITSPTTNVEYTCPMHPQIVRDAPGFCPICGMALEPRTVTGEEDNKELIEMMRRFKIGLILTIPLLLLLQGNF